MPFGQVRYSLRHRVYWIHSTLQPLSHLPTFTYSYDYRLQLPQQQLLLLLVLLVLVVVVVLL